MNLLRAWLAGLPAYLWSGWGAVASLLLPAAPGRFVGHPVRAAVGAAASNGPQLLDPLPPDQLHGVVDPMSGEVLGG